METIHLTIPDMKSAHCQMTVTHTVNAIGSKVKSIAPAKAEIELNEGLSRNAIYQAIRKAGYNVVTGIH